MSAAWRKGHVQHVALLVLCAWLGAAQATLREVNFTVPLTIPGPGNERWRINGKINVCTSPWTPMVDCDLDRTAAPEEVGGFLNDLANLVFKRVGWTTGDYVYTCMDWDDMVDDLASDNGTCYVSTAGIVVSTENASKGLKFSWTMYRNFLSILIYAPGITYDTWGFLSPFTWDLWLALVLTAFGVGFIVWLAEWASTQRAATGSRFSQLSLKCVSSATWQTTGKLVQVTQQLDTVNTLGARVIVWSYSLLIMVAIATYTGKTAAILTSTSINTNIHGLADLKGKAVATWDGYMDIFDGLKGVKYPFRPLFMPWNNKNDEQVMLDTLRSGKISALVIDIVFAENKVSQACDLHIVGETFEPTDLAFVFPKGFPDDNIIQKFSYALKANEEDSLIDPLNQRYFNGSSACGDASAPDGAISFQAMLGLWYIMGASFLFALFAIAASHISWATGTNARLKKSASRILSKTVSASGGFTRSLSHSLMRSFSRSASSGGRVDAAQGAVDRHKLQSGRPYVADLLDSTGSMKRIDEASKDDTVVDIPGEDSTPDGLGNSRALLRCQTTSRNSSSRSWFSDNTDRETVPEGGGSPDAPPNQWLRDSDADPDPIGTKSRMPPRPARKEDPETACRQHHAVGQAPDNKEEREPACGRHQAREDKEDSFLENSSDTETFEDPYLSFEARGKGSKQGAPHVRPGQGDFDETVDANGGPGGDEAVELASSCGGLDDIYSTPLDAIEPLAEGMVRSPDLSKAAFEQKLADVIESLLADAQRKLQAEVTSILATAQKRRKD